MDALPEDKVLRDDGTAAAARARLKQSLEDLNAVISFDRKMRRGSPGFMNAEWNQKSLAAKGKHQLNCNRWI